MAHGGVQLPLGVGEKVLRRSCFGPGAGHAGDVGLRAGRRGVVLAARDDERLVALAAGLSTAASSAVRAWRVRSSRPKPARRRVWRRRCVRRARRETRSIEPENSTTAASSPTTAPTATATAARPTMPDQPRVGPLAIARPIAPTSTPKTSVNGTMSAIGACVASADDRASRPASDQRAWLQPATQARQRRAILLVDTETLSPHFATVMPVRFRPKFSHSAPIGRFGRDSRYQESAKNSSRHSDILAATWEGTNREAVLQASSRWRP